MQPHGVLAAAAAATAGDTDQQEANFYVLPTAYRTLNNGMIISILY